MSDRIDLHHHFVPQVYKDALIACGSACPPPGYQTPLRDWSVTRSLEAMDEAGIGSAVLSITTPGIHLGDDAQARLLARACNEAGARLVIDHPGRFGLFAALPLPDVDGSLAEIAYALDQLKADGIGFYTNYAGKFLGDEAFAPVFAELNRRQAVAFVHPTAALCCSGLQPKIPDAIIEYGTDTTRTIGSLVFSGGASRHPHIRFVFCHAGGTMPYLIDRFAGFAQNPAIAARLPQGLMHELGRFFYDCAQTVHPAPLQCLTKLVPTSQLVFGTDYPYGVGCLGHVTGLARCGFSASELVAIERDNALGLVPRFGNKP